MRKFFFVYFIVLVGFVFYLPNLHAELNLPGNVTLNAIENQIDQQAPVDTQQKPLILREQDKFPKGTDTPELSAPVIVNQEVIDNSAVIVQPLSMPNTQVLSRLERSPFNRIKQLEGRWEGSSEKTSADNKERIVIVYEVTAGGNAVMERIFPETSQEMITMYYEENEKLALTHYCMIGERAQMILKPFMADNNFYEFNLINTPAFDPTRKTHMHSLKITFIDENHMNQEWEMYEAGKPSGHYAFVLTRFVDDQ